MRVRRVTDGAIGTVIDRDKGKRVQLEDDHLGERLLTYLEHDWVPVVAARPLSPAHIAEICHAADAMLCRRAGLRMPKAWHELTPDDKREWIEEGPSDVKLRQRLWRYIQAAVKELREDS